MNAARAAGASAGSGVILAAGTAALMAIQSRQAARAIGAANGTKFRGIAGQDLTRGEGDRVVRIAILGDSLAAGIGASSPGTTPGGVIASIVAERSPGLRVEILNRARAWSGARHLAAQAARLPANPPDIALVVTGANDAPLPRHARESARHLQDCVSALTARGVQVVCCTCPDLSAPTALPAPLRQYAGLASRMLARRQAAAVRRAGGIPVPIHLLACPKFRADPGLLSGDRFHPGDRGYRLAAEPVADEILRLLAAREDGPGPAAVPARMP